MKPNKWLDKLPDIEWPCTVPEWARTQIEDEFAHVIIQVQARIGDIVRIAWDAGVDFGAKRERAACAALAEKHGRPDVVAAAIRARGEDDL